MTSTSYDVNKLSTSIELIEKYVTDVDVSAVIDVLEAMKKNLGDDALVAQLSAAIKPLGIHQGAILTYAPYLTKLLLDDSLEGINNL